MSLLVVLDRQHTGKLSNTGDTGGHSVLSGLSEAHMVHKYLMAAEWELRSKGVAVVPVSDGDYSDRHVRAKLHGMRFSRAIYVACHLNAGDGDYGAVFHDHRSQMGVGVASFLARELHNSCPELDGTKVIPAKPGDWTANAYYTIRGVYNGKPCGICYEPAFMDHLEHTPLLTDEGLVRIGMSLAKGILDWRDSLEAR